MRTSFQFPVVFGSLFSPQSEQLHCVVATSSSGPSAAESSTTAGVIGSQRQPLRSVCVTCLPLSFRLQCNKIVVPVSTYSFTCVHVASVTCIIQLPVNVSLKDCKLNVKLSYGCLEFIG